MQVRTDEKKIVLLRRSGERYRTVTSEANWPTYNGETGGNRYTTLTQITKENVGRLAPRWMSSIPDVGSLQGTPIVVDGVMYVTAPNECYALDAGTGRRIWHFKRPRTKGVTQGGANRGAGIAGDRLFMQTDNAHTIALNRFTGELLWDTELADWRQNYSASSAPLPAGNLVISGVSGGEHGANGFVAAHDQETGKEAWRFWTVPKPGEPGSETWQGKDIEHGGAPTWFTGSYDAALDTVYWPTGNPGKEYNGDDRKGDNLYANSILALDRQTGKLKWHYQFTPHDLWDWDATQTSVLVDVAWEGLPRRLMLHAARNGFFYVFDRENGKLLHATAFVRNLTWATGIGADGRPIKVPGQEPSPAGPRSVRPRTAPPTGSRRRSTLRQVSITCRPSRSAASTPRAIRAHGSPASRISAAHSEPRRIPSRARILKAIDIRTGAILGAAAARPGAVVGRHADDGYRPRDLRRGERQPDGRRCHDRQADFEFSDQSDVEGVSHDLHVRRQAVHRGCGRLHHHRLRDCRLT